MQTKLSELSIFFPFWNEEQNVEQVVLKAKEVAKKVAKKWEIIMIDDGSTDKTLEIMNRLVKEDERFRVISHQPNRGYGSSLKEGLTHAQYKYIVFTDGDGQFDFSEVASFIEKIYTADIVIGYRKIRNDHNISTRLILMNLLKIWDWMLFRFHFKDIDCGFKMFTRRSLDILLPLRSEGAIITTEILAKATKKKLIIKQVGVTHYRRQHGISSGANIPVIIRAVLESLILWWDIKNGRF